MGTMYTDKLALIVDDQEFVRKIVKTMLTQMGFLKIEVAADGTEALAAVEADRPNLIICDINMKPMNGLEFIKTLRDKPEFYHRPIPIIFLTGEFSQDQATQAMELGCKSFLLKPVAPRKLQEKIDEIFGIENSGAED